MTFKHISRLNDYRLTLLVVVAEVAGLADTGTGLRVTGTVNTGALFTALLTKVALRAILQFRHTSEKNIEREHEHNTSSFESIEILLLRKLV